MPAERSSVARYRERCYTCFRPVHACFCSEIPSIRNKTGIIILQHVKERFHAFNTARIVRAALQNCQLIVDQTPALAQLELPITANTGVLYPGTDSQLLSETRPSERPEELIILDGTWHHARTFMKQIPWLQSLKRFCLKPASPSTYRIRKEPTETAVSTLEATVAALKHLEPETQKLDQLTHAFDVMIERQLQHPRQSSRIRHNRAKSRPKVNVPQCLLENRENLVVVYGETSFGGRGVREGARRPIYWVAERLATAECLELPVCSGDELNEEFLRLLELERADFENGDRLNFKDEWAAFSRPQDIIVAFNDSTLRMLKSAGVPATRQVSLKSVNLGLGVTKLEEILAVLNVSPSLARCRGRSGRRLANAVALTRYLLSLQQ